MRKRLWFGSSAVLFVVLVSLLVWQGSFTFGAFGPSTAREIYLFWALSTVMFILTVILGFMLFRTAVKLYIERQINRPGSHIKMKLIGGALALSFLPVLFLVIFSVGVLNRNLETWFSRPARNMNVNLIQVATILDHEMGEKLRAQGLWLSAIPQASADVYQRLCAANEIERAEILGRGRAGADSLLASEITRRRVIYRDRRDLAGNHTAFGADARESGREASGN